MKKLTAGIFTVLLGIVSVNAADAKIASQGYVDEQIGSVETSVTELTETVNGNTTNITNLTKTVGDNKADADKKIGDITTNVTNLQTTVNNLTTGENSVAGQIAEALGAYTTTINMNKALELKADKATTYTKTEADAAFDAKGAAAAAQTAATTAAATDATNKVNELANGAVKTNTDSIAAMDTAYKAADKAINDKIGTLPEGVTSITQLINNTTGENSELAQAVAQNTENIATNTGNIETINTNLGLLAGTKIPATCSTDEDGCTLVYRGGAFIWESVSRGTAE